jgi:hypothetical protein
MNDDGIRSDGDAEWLTWRSQGVGASDVAAAWTGSYGGAYRAVETTGKAGAQITIKEMT